MKKVTPVDEWQKAIIEHLKLLKEEEKREFAHKVIFDIALEVGMNGYEMIGLLENVKLNLFDHLNNMMEHSCEDCDNTDCPDHPDNKK
jgi:hypothetical protein